MSVAIMKGIFSYSGILFKCRKSVSPVIIFRVISEIIKSGLFSSNFDNASYPSYTLSLNHPAYVYRGHEKIVHHPQSLRFYAFSLFLFLSNQNAILQADQ